MEHPTARYPQMIWARISDETARQIAEAAREDKREKSVIVRLAIEEWLDRRRKLEHARKAWLEAVS